MKSYTFRLLWFIYLCVFNITLVNAKSICIVVPAYNEETRIGRTLEHYAEYFKTKPEKTTFLVVANNCSDNTVGVVQELQKKYPNVEYINLKPGGKGFAIKEGFLWALKKDFNLIGMVDADMATLPQYFYDLIIACNNADGAIASRYIKGAHVEPSRPWLRKIGGKFYNWMLRKQFKLPYKDTQCGAKVFSYDTVQKSAPLMEEKGWAWDLEFLYLCKLENKTIKEVPTTWCDQPGSHLSISSGVIKDFLNSPKRIKQRHLEYKKKLKQQSLINKKNAKKSKKSKKN
ncbi:glycosyltransferase [Candidatus Babeliales bacterium]|nr:glycosyltransferase [Candidatus Babeliales bacterium]